jgi:hypothetical protein
MKSIKFFESYIKESTTTLMVRELTTSELKVISDFVDMVSILFDYIDGNKTRGTFKRLKDDLTKYKRYGWYEMVNSYVSDVQNTLDMMDKAIAKSDGISDKIRQATDKLYSAFISKDVDKILSVNKNTRLRQLVDTRNNASIDLDKTLAKIRNPFQKSGGFIFQTAGFLDALGEDTLKSLLAKDYKIHKYTYLTTNNIISQDYEYLVHLMKTATTDNRSVSLANHEYLKYSEFAYANNQGYIEFKELVDDYLKGSGDRKLIPKIADKIRLFPEIHASNEKFKLDTTEVYRGLGFFEGRNEDGDPGIESIKKRDEQQRWLATTDSFEVAKRFARGRGHIMYNKDMDRDVSYILIYRVNKDSIMFDTNSFGGAYQEDEITIDIKKSKLVGYYKFYKGDRVDSADYQKI